MKKIERTITQVEQARPSFTQADREVIWSAVKTADAPVKSPFPSFAYMVAASALGIVFLVGVASFSMYGHPTGFISALTQMNNTPEVDPSPEVMLQPAGGNQHLPEIEIVTPTTTESEMQPEEVSEISEVASSTEPQFKFAPEAAEATVARLTSLSEKNEDREVVESEHELEVSDDEDDHEAESEDDEEAQEDDEEEEVERHKGGAGDQAESETAHLTEEEESEDDEAGEIVDETQSGAEESEEEQEDQVEGESEHEEEQEVEEEDDSEESDESKEQDLEEESEEDEPEEVEKVEVEESNP
ncbi:MAG: hypothetical protein KC877_02880 [Candidatus Kaiserbacteria bacterium]|nr:hypothetical protein [Candidatus Kaiserbacteria bacterium]